MYVALSVLGSIASIGAAFWAFVEARRARSSAMQAERVRSEMIDRRHLVEVSQLLPETRRILQSVSRVGPASTDKKLKGVDCSEIAREVDEYSRLIGEMEAHFVVHFQNKARELRGELRPLISALADASSFDQKKAAGMLIHEKIDGFLPLVKELLDDRRESSVTIGH